MKGDLARKSRPAPFALNPCQI